MKRKHAMIGTTEGKPGHGRRARGAVVVAAVLGASLLGFSCDGKDETKCQSGLEGVRASLKAGDTGLLTRWRTYAFKYCDEAEFATVDTEITTHQAEQKRLEAEKLKKEKELKALLDVFLGWVAQHKAAPEGAAANPTCDGGPAEEASKERWCVGRRQAGPHPLEVRYWEKESVAAAFHVQLPHGITCDALGPAQVLRSWTVQGSIKRHHCQITGGAAAGMQAIVTEAAQAPLNVFSPQYLERDPPMKQKVTSEGL